MANANGSIDEIIGQQAYQQVDQMKAKLAELEQSFIATAKAASSLMSTNVGGGTGNGGIKATTQSLTELEKATQKLIKANNEYGSDLVKIKTLLAQQTAANKTNAKELLSATGSYNQLEAQMKALLSRYKSLSGEMQKSDFGKAMAADIAKLNSELKSLDSALGNNQRNVGNYANVFTKVWSGLRQAAYILPGLGIAGIFNLIGEGVSMLIEKLQNLTQVIPITSESFNVMNEALASGEYKQAIKDVSNLTEEIYLAKKGFLDKNETLKHYNDTLGETIGYAKDLDTAESLLVKGGEAYIRMTLLKAAANLALDKAAQSALEAEIKQRQGKKDISDKTNDEGIYKPGAIQSFILLFTQGIASDADNAEKALDSLVKKVKDKGKEFSDIAKQLSEEAAKIAKQNNFDYFGGTGDNNNGKTRVELLQQEYEQELLAAKRQSADLEENESQAFFRRLKIVEKYSNDKLLSSKDLNSKEKEQATKFEEQLLNIVIDGTAKRKEENKKYLQMDVEDFKLNLKIKKEQADKAEEDNKDKQKHILELIKLETNLYKKSAEDSAEYKKKKAKEEAEARIKLEEDIANAISSISDSIISAIYSRKLRQFDAIDKKITETYNNELRYIEQSGLSSKQKEREKQILEAETEAKRKKNDRDRVDALRKQAKLQKALDINSLIASTAIAVMAALGAKPYTPANIALAAGAAVTGAAQLAKVIATPLPQYAKGRKGGKAEWAIVGEQGIEGIRTPDGKMSLTPDKPTVTFLPKDAEVIPHHEMIKNAAFVNLAKQSQVTVDKYQQALIAKFEEELEELRGIKSAILNKEFGNAVNVYKGFEQYKNSNIR